VGLFGNMRRIVRGLGIARRDEAHAPPKKALRRAGVFETVEPRVMLNGIGLFDPLEVGAVYIEGDTGSDGTGDTIEISFNGGGPNTTLDRVIISGDKAFDYGAFLQNEQAGPLTDLDAFFDTVGPGEAGDNFGKDLASPFQLVDATGIDSFNVQSVDGTSLLVLEFTGFDPGEKFTFTIDVDQVISLAEVPVSEGLDAITSGVEFQNSTLAAEFSAPGFHAAAAVGKFKDAYDRFLVDRTLKLTPDNGFDPANSIRDRTAGVAFDVEQNPLPISISGTVFHDRDLDLLQERDANPNIDEHGIDGVSLQLWKLNGQTGAYEDTGHRAVTAGGGHYEFGENLGLAPGVYEVREGPAAGYFDVGAIAGEVAGSDTGERGETADPATFATDDQWNRFHNVLTRIEIPLGGQHAVEYDFAEAKLAEVSGFVYHDRDDDGLKDAHEEGLGGVPILIQPHDWPLPGEGPAPTAPDFGPGGGRITATTTTNPDGSYKFENMRPGRYRIIQLEQPAGFNDGIDTAGTVDGAPVGAAINPLSPGRIEDVVLVSDAVGVDYNFGELLPVSIHGNVHISTPDGDCFGDDPAQQTPVEGARVELWNADGTELLATTFTDAAGDYSFTDLRHGTYRVREYTPSDLLDGAEHVGSVAGVGSVGAVTGSDDTEVAAGQTLGYDEIAGITLLSGQSGVHYDFCEHQPAELSGYVYHDRDDDGLKENGEEGIAGVTMSLIDSATGSLVATTVTDADGFYRFTDLHAGIYRVEEGPPGAEWTDGKDTAGTVTRDGVPVSPASFGFAQEPDAIRQVQVGYGDVGTEYNFGEIKLASIHGRVHLSTPEGDCFGEDPAEQRPVVGAKVELWNADETQLLETTLTDENGDYWFMNLRPGDYTVREYTPEGLLDGDEHIGQIDGQADLTARITGRDDDEIAPGVTLGYDEISGIALTSGQKGEHYDFCEHEPAKISGFVYHDRDNDGAKEAGEEGIAGVTMTLIDMDTGSAVATTATDATGMYMFGDLLAGRYKVQEGDPGAPWLDGIDTAGTLLRDGALLTGATNSDVGAAMEPDMIVDVDLLNGDRGENYNFGEYLPGSISGRVYLSDPHGDCELEPGQSPERPLAGVTVKLYDGDVHPDHLVATTLANAAGEYHFEGLDPGSYTVVEQTPGDLLDGNEHVGSHGGIVIDAENRQSVIGDIVLTSGDDGIEYDFCEHEPAKISGFVYHDRDNDGAKEAGEEGIAGVTMTLIDMDTGSAVATTATDATGMYMFGDLLAGRYKVQEGDPGAAWIDGIDTAGTLLRDGVLLTGATNSDVGAAVEPDMIIDVDLLNGDRGEHYNFGEYLPGSISGFVFLHPEGDCLLEPHETPDAGLAGIEIELLDANGAVVQTTATNVDGSYRFDRLAPGTYTVREGETPGLFDGDEAVGYRTLETGFATGPGNDRTDDQLRDIAVTSGDAMIHYNFCEAPPASISGYVFQDGAPVFSLTGNPPANINALRDGVRTADDAPIAGVTLELRHTFSGDPVLASEALEGTYASGPIRTTTNSAGFYEFTGLRAGNYTVVQIHPDDFFDHLDTAGTRDGAVNGVAVNRTSDISPAVFSGWTNSPPLDTIALIGLPAGSESVENNFSEVRVFSTPIFPPPPPQTPPAPPVEAAPPPPQPAFVPPAPQSFTPAATRAPLAPLTGYTWHLSVVDAGQPRQVSDAGNAPFFSVSTRRSTAWDGRNVNEGTWKFAEVDRRATLGLEDGTPVAADFNGDGVDEIGVYLDGQWYIDLNGNGRWDSDDLWAELGDKADRPVTGDWDGDGKDDIGIFGPIWERDPLAIRHDPGLPDQFNPHDGKPKNLPPKAEEATAGARAMQRTERGFVRQDLIDHVFLYGQASDAPVTGDWNGDGITAIGVFQNGRWKLDSNGDGRFTASDETVYFGAAGDLPVVGDFNGDGVDELGIYRGGTWIMDTNGNREIDAQDKVFELGGALDRPVAGDFNGDGLDEPAVYRSARPQRVAAQPRR